MQVKDSIAFVTGANRGIGLAFAQELLARGAKKVYAGVRNPEGINVPGVVAVKLDVTDAESVAAAVAQCSDVTLLVNNAGIASLLQSTLDPAIIDDSRRFFETNYYGVIRVSQGFAPVLLANGGGAIVNVLSNATWISMPILAAYCASKSAAWSFTNALRLEVREQGIQVLGLHVGFVDTDLTHGFDAPKVSPQSVAIETLDALEAGKEEVFADEGTKQLKAALSSEQAPYLSLPA